VTGVRRRPGLRIALLAALLSLAGCATRLVDQRAPHPQDPWEGYNRRIHAFNNVVDEFAVRPLARGYQAVTPDPVERGIGNFFDNLTYPLVILNLGLQGKFGAAVHGVGRFALNTTVGFLGFFDVATPAGLAAVDEDFGQTLAAWGWEESRFFVLPFLGPYTLRDSFDPLVASYLSPPAYIARHEDVYWLLALRLVELRARLLGLQDDIDAAYDPYAFVRDAYLQRREFLIYDGEPPPPDYDALLAE
jgi:phospholipid-binding lipoprotein MlaA